MNLRRFLILATLVGVTTAAVAAEDGVTEREVRVGQFAATTGAR